MLILVHEEMAESLLVRVNSLVSHTRSVSLLGTASSMVLGVDDHPMTDIRFKARDQPPPLLLVFVFLRCLTSDEDLDDDIHAEMVLRRGLRPGVLVVVAGAAVRFPIGPGLVSSPVL